MLEVAVHPNLLPALPIQVPVQDDLLVWSASLRSRLVSRQDFLTRRRNHPVPARSCQVPQDSWRQELSVRSPHPNSSTTSPFHPGQVWARIVFLPPDSATMHQLRSQRQVVPVPASFLHQDSATIQ